MRWPGRTESIVRPPIAAVNARAAQLAEEGRSLINLGQAVLGLPPPAAALKRAASYMQQEQVHGYTPDPGDPAVRAAVAEFLRERKGVSALPEQVMMTCGANQAYANALFAVTQPGDEVILLAPYYFDHLYTVQLATCAPVFVEMPLVNGRFNLDLDALEAALTARTRVVTLVAPANPAGMVVPEAQVKRLARLCAERGIWLVSDETYDLLTFPPHRHFSPAACPESERVLVTGSFSKTFALAGWRVGYLYGPEHFMDEAVKVQDALVVCAPVPSQMAVLGALESIDDYVPGALAELTARRDALLTGLAGIEWAAPIEPDGATFVLVGLPDGVDDVAMAMRILEEAGVVTVPGSAFGPAGAGFVRVSFGNLPVASIQAATERLSDLVSGP